MAEAGTATARFVTSDSGLRSTTTSDATTPSSSARAAAAVPTSRRRRLPPSRPGKRSDTDLPGAPSGGLPPFAHCLRRRRRSGESGAAGSASSRSRPDGTLVAVIAAARGCNEQCRRVSGPDCRAGVRRRGGLSEPAHPLGQRAGGQADARGIPGQDSGLKPLYVRASSLISRIGTVTIEHVPRARNTEADRLANLAMDEAEAQAGV